MKALLHKIIPFNHLNVIGVFRKDEEDFYYFLKTKKKKDTLSLLEVKVFSNWEFLIKELDSKTPLILLVDGKGVLHKRIDLKNEVDLNWIKNLDYKTIHHTAFINDRFQFISFVRKNVVEDIIEMFQVTGYQIVDFYVGATIGVLLNDSLQLSSLLSNNTVLTFEGTELETVNKQLDIEAKVYDFGETKVSNFHLPLYSAVLHFYFKQNSIVKSSSLKIDTDEIVYKKAFNSFGVITLVFFLLSLLISYFGIQYFTAENMKLNIENVYSTQSYQLIQKLEEQRLHKLSILKETGFTSSKYLSFYSYELSKDIPSEIKLSGLDLFPLRKEVKVNEKVAFTSGIIILNGVTRDEMVFNSWIESFRKLEWISNFEILFLKKDKKNNSQFEIKIVLKDV